MGFILKLDDRFKGLVDWLNTFLPGLVLRLFLAYEFGQAGINKFNGNNWFVHKGEDFFPFPFNLLSADINWLAATWLELLGAAALIVGLATRYVCVALIVVDFVAWASVHADNGYNVCQNGYQLPLMFMIMLVALLCIGPGKASVDNFIRLKK